MGIFPHSDLGLRRLKQENKKKTHTRYFESIEAASVKSSVELNLRESEEKQVRFFSFLNPTTQDRSWVNHTNFGSGVKNISERVRSWKQTREAFVLVQFTDLIYSRGQTSLLWADFTLSQPWEDGLKRGYKETMQTLKPLQILMLKKSLNLI